MARRTTDLESLAPSFHELRRDFKGACLHEVRRARNSAGVRWRIFVRINHELGVTARKLIRRTTGDGSRHRQLRASTISEKIVRRLRPELGLPIHIRENLE